MPAIRKTADPVLACDQNSREKNKARITVLVLASCAAILTLVRFLTGPSMMRNGLPPFWAEALFFINVFVSYFLLLILFVKSRLAAYVLLPLCAIVQLLSIYIETRYGLCLASELVTAALETSWRQVSGFIYPSHYVLVPLALLLMAGGIYLLRRLLSPLPELAAWKAWTAAGLYISLSTAVLLGCIRFFPETASYLVANDGHNVSQNSSQYRKTLIARMQEESSIEYIYPAYLPLYWQMAALYHAFDYYCVSPLKNAADLPSHSVFEDPDLTVVLVIGESFRSDHSPWNGYERNTLPQLTAIAGDNVVNFPTFKSYGTTTITSIYGMLSDATCRNRQATHTSFLEILKKHGFENRLLVSRTGFWYNNPHIHALINGALDSIEWSHDNDGICRQFSLSLKPRKQLIVLEDGTGHFPYRHEDRFKVFDESDTDNRVNPYDNCLIQTDDLLSRLVKVLKNRNAVLVYSSDHGQSFGEQGFWMHGGLLTAEKQRHVFSFVWFSDTFRKRHSELVANIRSNRLKALSHDDLYHSILSLCGIESAVQKPELDFTKPLPRPDVSSFSLEDEQQATR